MVCDAAKKEKTGWTAPYAACSGSRLVHLLHQRFVRHTHAMDQSENAELKSPLDLAFKDAYPSLAEAERREAKVNFSRYIEIAFKIVEDDLAVDGSIDTSGAKFMIKERSNRTPKQ